MRKLLPFLLILFVGCSHFNTTGTENATGLADFVKYDKVTAAKMNAVKNGIDDNDLTSTLPSTDIGGISVSVPAAIERIAPAAGLIGAM